MAEAHPHYDRIGAGYAELRQPDPRIARRTHDALGSASTILNVGAGTGSYEPEGKLVTAIEPSAEMIRQRKPTAAPAIQGRAENLPFADDSFDAAMAILTVHHWTDKARGLCEMRRVARGPVVILTFDPACKGSWLTDYIPQLVALDEAEMPPISEYPKWLGPVEISPVPVPRGCTDGLLYAYWDRPEAYLDPQTRRGSSSFWTLESVEIGLAKLANDLANRDWNARYGHLLELDELDVGYRLVRTI